MLGLIKKKIWGSFASLLICCSPRLYTSSKLMGNESPSKTPSFEIEREPKGLNLETILQQALTQRLKDTHKLNHYSNLLEKCLNDPIKDRALGCLFGSFIGDSLGSYCEFSKSVSDDLMDQVMTMPGGGVFDLLPGQLTDDSELASHLLRGLSTLDPEAPFPAQHFSLLRAIASEYATWLDSNPFDIGITCKKGITHLKSSNPKIKGLGQTQMKPIFQNIFKGIDHENKDSESNGSLMRITPMAILFSCSKMKVEEHQQFIKDEVRLIHSKDVALQASYLWVNVLSQLIRRTNDSPSTFQTIFHHTDFLDRQQLLGDWFKQAKKVDKMPATVKIGWAKIAWTYGMQQLRRLSSQPQNFDQDYYKKIVGSVIKQAGDTDTNGCIMGGMVGALTGFKKLPPWYMRKLLSVKFQEAEYQSSQNRPMRYQPFIIMLEALDMIDKCQRCGEGRGGGENKKEGGV